MKLNPKLAALPLAGVMAFGLVACGDDSDDSAATTTTTVATTTTMPMDEMEEMDEASADIVATAVAAGSFGTLATALTAADLVETLQGPGPFTVFAPTDDAFKALPAGTLDSLLLAENKETLSGILTYHVVSGKVMAADLSDGQVVKTVQGENLTVNIEGDKVSLTDANGKVANVTATDIAASNGVIHVIDAVLIPA